LTQQRQCPLTIKVLICHSVRLHRRVLRRLPIRHLHHRRHPHYHRTLVQI